jgi:ketosteroid isomerase-like protein
MELLSNPMKFLSCGAAVFLPFLAAAGAETPASDPNARSLAAAETAFAHESETSGMRTAFLHALSEDGIVFQPEPQNGRKAWEAKKDSGGVLRWQPVLAVAAASGDFGYTTGPWTFKKSADDKDAAFGQFVSIWRRENGKWKLLFDLGTDNPAPSAETPTLRVIDNHAPNDATSANRENMFAQDRAYAADQAAKFSAVASEEIRLYEPGKSPVIGKTAAEAALRAASPVPTFGEPKGDIAPNGDLGFAWGEYSRKEKGGYYLRIWRKNGADQWQLVLDLLRPR